MYVGSLCATLSVIGRRPGTPSRGRLLVREEGWVMSPPEKHRSVFLLLLAGVALVLAATAAGGTSAVATTATFTDPAGDSRGGPDITTVMIDGDAATGMLNFGVAAPGYLPATPDALTRRVQVWIDTDPTRGDPEDGTDYGLTARNDSSGRWWGFGKWNGSAWEAVPPTPTIDFTRPDSIAQASRPAVVFP